MISNQPTYKSCRTEGPCPRMICDCGLYDPPTVESTEDEYQKLGELLVVSSKPTIVAAAIKILGMIVSLPKPARHPDIIQPIWQKIGYPPYEEGFLTDEGQFIDRKAALALVLVNQQPLVDDVPILDELFSENLW